MQRAPRGCGLRSLLRWSRSAARWPSGRGTLLGGTDEGVLVQAAADIELWESQGHRFLTILDEAVLDRLCRDDGMKVWVAEGGGRMVSAGRLEPVPGTAFAGIWGGVTRAARRGRGIYRALTAARAESALRMGATLIHSDSTEFSPPDS